MLLFKVNQTTNGKLQFEVVYLKLHVQPNIFVRTNEKAFYAFNKADIVGKMVLPEIQQDKYEQVSYIFDVNSTEWDDN